VGGVVGGVMGFLVVVEYGCVLGHEAAATSLEENTGNVSVWWE
jgi:hypothetical protein